MNIKTKFANSFKEFASTKSIALAGVLLGIIVVIGFFANFTLNIFPLVKISFTFLPQSIGAMILGPAVSGFMCALGDILSFILNPQGGGYFPGWTISAALTGLIFGIFLYKYEATLKNIIIAKLIIVALVETFLGSLWLQLQFGLPFFEMLFVRGGTSLASAPIEIAIIFFVGKAVARVTQKMRA